MGTFSASYLRAAQAAARRSPEPCTPATTGCPWSGLSALDDLQKKRYGTSESPGFAALCAKLPASIEHTAGLSPPKWNGHGAGAGSFTTHNLAQLIGGLDLSEDLRPALPDLSRRCFSGSVSDTERWRRLARGNADRQKRRVRMATDDLLPHARGRRRTPGHSSGGLVSTCLTNARTFGCCSSPRSRGLSRSQTDARSTPTASSTRRPEAVVSSGGRQSDTGCSQKPAEPNAARATTEHYRIGA